MNTVTSLCNECILLEEGQMLASGTPDVISDLYYSSGAGRIGSRLSFNSDKERPGTDIAKLCEARLINERGHEASNFDRSEKVGVEITYEVLWAGCSLIPNFRVLMQDLCIFISSPSGGIEVAPGLYKSTMWIPSKFLNSGYYTIAVALSSPSPVVVHFYEGEALQFHVTEDITDPDRNGYTLQIPGFIRPVLNWDFEKA